MCDEKKLPPKLQHARQKIRVEEKASWS